MNENREILATIKQFEKIVIYAHTNPDGDAYGSQAGMKAFIEETFPDKKVYMTGSGFRKAFSMFEEMDKPTEDDYKDSLGIVVDVSDLERIEDQHIVNTKTIVKIDHHMGSEVRSFALYQSSDTTATSAAQMVGQFILDNGYTISKRVAERLFLGIVTDSARFLYLNNESNIFPVMDAILKSGMDFQKIYDCLYEGDEKSARAKGYISCYFKKTRKGVAYIILDKNLLKSLKIDYNYASTMVNCLSGIRGLPVWVSFAESDEGKVRVELRSRRYNVQQVALKFNGGGHLQASGAVLNSIKECHRVIEELDKLIEEK